MNLNLLIAEDEKYLREKVTKNIEWSAYGYNLFIAADGEEALRIAESEPIHIVVTDIRMPGIDGLKLTERIKAINQDIKVIIISGYAEFELAQSSLRLGVEDYLLKPFRSQRLFSVVEKTKKQIIREREQASEERKQRRLAEKFLRKRVSDVFEWLADPNFFINQTQMLIRKRLEKVLKTGTLEEFNQEISLLHEIIDDFETNYESIFILLNDIVIATLTTVQDMGFESDDVIKRMSKHFVPISEGDFTDLKQWIENFLLDINTLIKSRQDGGSKLIVKTIKEYIDQNYQKGISLHTLADQLNVSSSQLSKLFLEHTGENFSDYVNRLKEQKAKELLKSTDQLIYEIAENLGFSNAYYFSSWFKKQVGCSPTEYREGVSTKE